MSKVEYERKNRQGRSRGINQGEVRKSKPRDCGTDHGKDEGTWKIKKKNQR